MRVFKYGGPNDDPKQRQMQVLLRDRRAMNVITASARDQQGRVII